MLRRYCFFAKVHIFFEFNIAPPPDELVKNN